jgi:hypothetical protein
MPSISNYLLDATQILVDAIVDTVDQGHCQQSCHMSVEYDSWSLGTSSGLLTYLRHSAKVSELSQKFTEYAGFLTLEEVLSEVHGVVERSPKDCRVRAVLDNDPFEVNDLEETTVKFNIWVNVDNDKFNVGVDVNNDSTVEGVTAARAAIRERFDFLSPVPDKLSSN